jgi:hypothetical protein
LFLYYCQKQRRVGDNLLLKRHLKLLFILKIEKKLKKRKLKLFFFFKKVNYNNSQVFILFKQINLLFISSFYYSFLVVEIIKKYKVKHPFIGHSFIHPFIGHSRLSFLENISVRCNGTVR